MNRILDTDQMYSTIISFLSLDEGSRWHFQTVSGVMTIEFSGDQSEVRKRVFEWLQKRAIQEVKF